MTRYPHLPPAVLRLLEAEPWQGTPTELFAALEPYRVEIWPANPVSLSLWLKHHAGRHGITVTRRHTGERRLLRLERGANGLQGVEESTHTAAAWCFSTWPKLEAALPGILEVVSGEVTLAFDIGRGRVSQAVPITWLPLVVGRWAAQFPQAHEVRIYRGEVEVVTAWPFE